VPADPVYPPAAAEAVDVDSALRAAAVPLTAANQGGFYTVPASLPERSPCPRPMLEKLAAELTDNTVHDFQRATTLRHWVSRLSWRYPEGGRTTVEGAWGDFSGFPLGGTEEQVIAKGSPLAAEQSRLLVALAALAGIHARIVILGDTSTADAGQTDMRHVVTELFVGGRWSVFDPVSDRAFAWMKHGFASAWELHQMPRLLDGLQDHRRLPYVGSRYYRSVAIAHYDPWSPDNDYTQRTTDAATAARLRAGLAG
jgi:hypothetical protein